MGARRMMFTGLVVFVAASATTGLAPNTATLIGGGIGQGVGAALLSPAALALVTVLFQGSDCAEDMRGHGESSIPRCR